MQRSPKQNKPKKRFNIKIMPDPNLKIGVFLNFGDFWYSLWKINVVDPGFFKQWAKQNLIQLFREQRFDIHTRMFMGIHYLQYISEENS